MEKVFNYDMKQYKISNDELMRLSLKVAQGKAKAYTVIDKDITMECVVDIDTGVVIVIGWKTKGEPTMRKEKKHV